MVRPANMEKPPYQPVVVTWIDAHHHDHSPATIEDVLHDCEDFVIHTPGFLIYEDEERLVLASELMLDDEAWHTKRHLSIPRWWVKQIARMRLSKGVEGGKRSKFSGRA